MDNDRPTYESNYREAYCCLACNMMNGYHKVAAEKFGYKYSKLGKNIQDVVVIWSGPFNMIILLIRRFLRKADLYREPNHELISEYRV